MDEIDGVIDTGVYDDCHRHRLAEDFDDTQQFPA